MTKRALVAVFACLAVGVAGQQPVDVALRVVDEQQRPLAGAVVYTLPAASWGIRSWWPREVHDCWGDGHEVLRRLGKQHTADDRGVARIPEGSVVAGESGELAGVLLRDEAGDRTMTLRSWRWTITVVDEHGRPVAGVPVGCSHEPIGMGENFEGLTIGVTDARGRVLARAPEAIELRRYMPWSATEPDPPAPKAAWLEVEGFYLDPHARKLSLAPGKPAELTLKMPPVVRLRMIAPARLRASTYSFWLDSTKGMTFDSVSAWRANGRWHALVGKPEKFDTYVKVVYGAGPLKMLTIKPGDGDCDYEPRLDEDCVVLRAHLRDADGKPLRWASLRSDPHGVLPAQNLKCDEVGQLHLALSAETMAKGEFTLKVMSGPDPQQFGSTVKVQVSKLGGEDLRPGAVHDVGVIRLAKPAPKADARKSIK